MCLIPVASIDRAALNIRTFYRSIKNQKDGYYQNSAVRVPELLRDVEWHGQPVSGVHTLDGVKGRLVVCAARGWTWCDIMALFLMVRHQVQVLISSKTKLLPRRNSMTIIRQIQNGKDQEPNACVQRTRGHGWTWTVQHYSLVNLLGRPQPSLGLDLIDPQSSFRLKSHPQ